MTRRVQAALTLLGAIPIAPPETPALRSVPMNAICTTRGGPASTYVVCGGFARTILPAALLLATPLLVEDGDHDLPGKSLVDYGRGDTCS
jgi:hypothetical protein